MRTLLASKALPSLVLGLQSIFFYGYGLAGALRPTNLRGLETRDNNNALFDGFTFQACSSEQTELLKNAYLNVHKILNAQDASFTAAKHYLVGLLVGQEPRRSPEVRKRLQTIKLFYGDFDETNECDIRGIMEVIDVVKKTVNIINDFAFSEAYQPTIICGDSHFEYVEHHEGKPVFRNKLDQAGRVVRIASDYEEEDDPPICDTGTSAAMLYPRPGSPGEHEDWMILCPSFLRWWSRPDDKPKYGYTYLSQYHDLSLDAMRGLDLEQLIDSTPEGPILHELTHSSKIFTFLDVNQNGQLFRGDLRLVDMEISPGYDAYTFDGVTALAREHKDNPIKMIRNAETIAYDGIATYLDKCYWNADGICEDLPS